jgi:hypothetical protein
MAHPTVGSPPVRVIRPLGRVESDHDKGRPTVLEPADL